MNIIDSISGAYNSVIKFFGEVFDMVKTSFDALETFYDMLVEFDERIVNMVNNCGTNEFDGLPINKAIATYHYVVGDVIFYLMYMVILVGCLFTIYKIVLLIYQAVMKIVDFVKAYLSSNILSLGSFLK